MIALLADLLLGQLKHALGCRHVLLAEGEQRVGEFLAPCGPRASTARRGLAANCLAPWFNNWM
jgi:hypothetical protein